MSRVGGGKQKVDTFSSTVEVELPTVDTIDDSVRKRAIQSMQSFYNQLQDTHGFVTEITAKNYDVNSEYFKEGGFAAQGPTSIKNFEAMLEAYDYKNVEELIYALLNIGPDTLSEDTTIISRKISTLIAYFLFDDIEMDVKSNLKGIHLFNLGNIYVPFSSFLQCAYDAIKDITKDATNFVRVEYNPNSIEYEHRQVLNYEDWVIEREKKYSNTKYASISVHFFKNFVTYITELTRQKN